jgi:hypothetical protein
MKHFWLLNFNLLIFFSFFRAYDLAAQTDFSWWNDIHNWDGVTPWNRMLIMDPGHMGPNAIPVPELRNGLIDSSLTLTIAPETYFGEGDMTVDLYTQVNIPFQKMVSLQITWIPVEYFKTDTVVRDWRLARTREAKGVYTGDVYISTVVQLIRDKKFWPDLILGINLKTASGNGINDARHTDSPGYYFDLAGGKNFPLKNNSSLRISAMAGFYVYQTNRDDYFQNDGLLWGAGLSYTSGSIRLQADCSGYMGYLSNLDNPVLFRIELRKYLSKCDLFLKIQQGNSSFPFTGIRMGTTFYLAKR